MTLKLFCLLTLCGGCSHAHDIAAGQKHELQEQHFVSDQGLDLHLKNFQNDSMKNGHLKVHTQSTVKYSYSHESLIIITCVLLTMSDIGKDC